LKIETLGQFWQLIRELKNNEVEEMHVHFLRKYTEGAFKCLNSKRNEIEKESLK